MMSTECTKDSQDTRHDSPTREAERRVFDISVKTSISRYIIIILFFGSMIGGISLGISFETSISMLFSVVVSAATTLVIFILIQDLYARRSIAMRGKPENDQHRLATLFSNEWHLAIRCIGQRFLTKTILKAIGKRFHKESLTGSVVRFTPSSDTPAPIRSPITVPTEPHPLDKNPNNPIVLVVTVAILGLFATVPLLLFFVVGSKIMAAILVFGGCFLGEAVIMIAHSIAEKITPSNRASLSKCFAVPGGLVFRKTFPFSSRWHVTLLTPTNTVLFFVAKTEQLTAISKDGKHYCVKVTPTSAMLALRAWQSPLPPPSADALCDLE